MGVLVRSITLASQGAVVVQPLRGSVTKLFVLCHGAGTDYAYPTGVPPSPYSAEWDGLKETIYYLAARDYTVVCPALLDTSLGLQGHTFGNNASTTKLSDVITAAQALDGVGDDKIVLAGISMGNCTTMNYIRRFGSSGVAGLVGIIPVCDLEWQYTDNGASTAVNAALGVANYASAASYDPKVIAADIDVPWLGWTNSNDESAPPEQAETLAGLIPNGLGVAEDRGAGTGHADLNGHDFSRMSGRDLHNWLSALTTW